MKTTKTIVEPTGAPTNQFDEKDSLSMKKKNENENLTVVKFHWG